MTRMLPADAIPEVSGSSRLSASLFFYASASFPPPITRPAPAIKCEAQVPMDETMHREARSHAASAYGCVIADYPLEMRIR